jgi:TPR repeat protein
MYAMFLRNGWAVEQDEAEAVRLLVLATDMAIANQNLEARGRSNPLGSYGGTLERANAKKSSAAVSQLVMAIYELGVSFKMGWGVPKDKINATYYLNMAAQLGDVDAQIELGHCFLRGDGVKQNKKQAAFWFRKAESHGARMVQMQWIWKDKYNMTEE